MAVTRAILPTWILRYTSLSLTYIGSIGRDLLGVTQSINLNPNFAFLGITHNSATSDYHALQLKFQRACRNGCKRWHRTPSRTPSTARRQMRLPTTSTRRHRSRIRTLTAATPTLTSAKLHYLADIRSPRSVRKIDRSVLGGPNVVSAVRR